MMMMYLPVYHLTIIIVGVDDGHIHLIIDLIHRLLAVLHHLNMSVTIEEEILYHHIHAVHHHIKEAVIVEHVNGGGVILG